MNCYLFNHSNFSVCKAAVRNKPSLQIFEHINCGLVVLSSLQHIHASHYEDSGLHGDTFQRAAIQPSCSNSSPYMNRQDVAMGEGRSVW